MGTITVDGRQIEFTNEKNVLSIIQKAGIDLPTLCYHKDLPAFGACRLCTVEDDRGRTFAACSEEPRDGMVIKTTSPKLLKYRRMIIELLLASHDRECTTCDESGSCTLQKLAHRYGVTNVRFANTRERREIDSSSPSIVRDPNKCVLCGNCVRVCDEIQGIGALGFSFRGTDATVLPAFDKPIAETTCVNCGQCRVACPTGAITIHTSMDQVWDAVADPDTRVVAQIAPAVRVAIGDAFGMKIGQDVIGRIVTALKRMGFDEVYDTIFSADMTILEESAEFLERVKSGGTLPLLTSCCPAWVKLVTDQYKDFIPNISTCRSPQGMMSAAVKEYYRDPERAAGKKTVMVSFMPCTAKKYEAKRPNSFTNGEQDTDIVITSTELIRMIQNYGLDFAGLEPQKADDPFGYGSGGGVIFGVTGGVTEAVIRRLMPDETPETLKMIAESGVRGLDGIKEFTIPYNGIDVKICVASGLANARKVLDSVRAGEKEYHLIEVMACRGGCVMGGGQPVHNGIYLTAERTEGIYDADAASEVKKPDANKPLLSLYDTFLGGKEHHLLHNEFY